MESGAEGLYCFTEVVPVLAPRGCCAVSSAGDWVAGVWDAQEEEEEREHHSHG